MTIQEEWDAMLQRGKIPVFEVEVIDKSNGITDWIVFDVRICDGYLEATHVALSKEEEESEFVATKVVEIYEDFDLEWHLERLFNICYESIRFSELYSLKMEETSNE